MLELVSYVFTLLFVAVSAAVGARLLWLARKTRGFPEIVLGAGLLITAGIGYPLTIAGRLLLTTAPETARWVQLTSIVPMNVGYAAVWIFTWRVFRRRSKLATAGMGAALLWLVGVGVASAVRVVTVDHPASIRIDSFVILGAPAAGTLSYLWGAVESFVYHAQMRRRLALGLSDPVVTDRFRLWGLVMTFAVASNGVAQIASARGIDIVTAPLVMLAAAIAGLACGVSMWLAFLPPRAYLRRVARTPAG